MSDRNGSMTIRNATTSEPYDFMSSRSYLVSCDNVIMSERSGIMSGRSEFIGTVRRRLR